APAGGGKRVWRGALQRDSFDELVSVVDVEDQNSGAAEGEVVAAANAGQSRVQKPLYLLCLRMPRKERGRHHKRYRSTCHFTHHVTHHEPPNPSRRPFVRCRKFYRVPSTVTSSERRTIPHDPVHCLRSEALECL